MTLLWIIAIGGSYLLVLAFVLFVVRPRANPQRIQVIVNTAGLPLPHEIEPTVAATLKRDVRLGFLAVTVGLIVSSSGLILANVHPFGTIVFIDFSAIFLSIGVGSVVGAIAREDARQKIAVRFARLRSVGISDYRSRLEQWAPRVLIALALGVFVFRVAVTPGGATATPPFLFIYAAAMLASLVVSEVGSRVLVRRGQPAGSALELAWDDALRSRALNAIAVAPLYLAGYFSVASIAFFPNSRSASEVLAVQLAAGLDIVFAGALLVWAIGWATRKPQQRYLRRLWPEFLPATAPATTPATAPQS